MLSTILTLIKPVWAYIVGALAVAGGVIYGMLVKRQASADVAAAQAQTAQASEAIAEANAQASADAVQAMKNATQAQQEVAQSSDDAIRQEARDLGIDRGAGK